MSSFMLATRTDTLPEGKEWYYEIKFDGYRVFLEWDGTSFQMISRNGRNLLEQFPEVLSTCEQYFSSKESFCLDGELVIFANRWLADFTALKSRHRLRSREKIEKVAQTHPACFLAFDMRMKNGKSLQDKTWLERKKRLESFFLTCQLPTEPRTHDSRRVQYLPATSDQKSIQETAQLYRSEGFVAKQPEMRYVQERSESWRKVKQPSTVQCFILSYRPDNGYFTVGVYKGKQIHAIGQFAHGFTSAEKQVLAGTVKENGLWSEKERVYELEPSIVVSVSYTTRTETDFREPRFAGFHLETPPNHCTWEDLQSADMKWPRHIEITHPEKVLWEHSHITKLDYLQYVRLIAPYALPFLKKRGLTVVRYPHGMYGESFFQKNRPDYAPDYVEQIRKSEIDYIVCNHLDTLLWLGNQLALEWHVPFHHQDSEFVSEIVFDLDPPNKEAFPLAIEGANWLKEQFDEIDLQSYVKFSGNKGLQVYIPLAKNRYHWEETSRFTETIGKFSVQKQPDLFTQERLKKNRDGKLYIDIPQHGPDKTIIAPYSLRGNREALVACPLYWNEVVPSLNRLDFTMPHVIERLLVQGCPFKEMSEDENVLPAVR